MERNDPEKLTHAEVGYEHPAKGPDHCSECEHYIVRANRMRCQIVKSPIYPQDWCRKFKGA